jgi:hypothetical protein
LTQPSLNPNDIQQLLEAAGNEVGELRNPLRKLKGRLVDITGEQKAGQPRDGQPGRVYFELKYHIDQLQVIESVIPYAYGTTVLQFNTNDINRPNPKSAYGVLVASQQRIMGDESRRTSAKGKTVEIWWTPGHAGTKMDSNHAGQWLDTQFEAYEFISIDGKTATQVPGTVPSPTAQPTPNGMSSAGVDIWAVMAELANGKDKAGWLPLVYADGRLRGTDAIAQLIKSDVAVIEQLKAKGLIKVDDKGVMTRP